MKYEKKAIIKTDILHHKHFRLYFSNTVSYFGKKALIKNKGKYVSILSSEWTVFSHCLIFSRAAAIDACFFKLCPRETVSSRDYQRRLGSMAYLC